MVKKKNLILSILAVILVCVSFTLFACGNSGNAKETFEAYKITMERYMSNENLFSTNTIENISTEFYLNNFYSKNDSGDKIKDDENYIILNAVGLNFINKYYTRLENLEGSYDFNLLNENLKKLNESYDVLNEEGQNLSKVEEHAEVDIYNGHFARYKSSSKNFINEVYKVALSMGDFFVNQTKINSTIGTENQNNEDLDIYIDYQLLMTFDDFRTILMQSCEGQVLNHQIYTSASSRLKDFAKNIQAKEIKSLSLENINEIKNVFEAFNNQRKSFAKAYTGFSLYKYLTTYEGLIDAYVKAESNVDIYYNQLLNYYCLDNNYITLFYNFLTTNLVN